MYTFIQYVYISFTCNIYVRDVNVSSDQNKTYRIDSLIHYVINNESLNIRCLETIYEYNSARYIKTFYFQKFKDVTGVQLLLL